MISGAVEGDIDLVQTTAQTASTSTPDRSNTLETGIVNIKYHQPIFLIAISHTETEKCTGLDRSQDRSYRLQQPINKHQSFFKPIL
jgi:hypothetical protein